MKYLASTLFLLAFGCLPYNAVERPAPPVDLPESYASAGDDAPRPQSRPADDRQSEWWLDFDDPTLADLEERLFGQNLELRASWSRLAQARAAADLAGAPRWPSIGLQASVSRQRQRFGAFEPQEFTNYSLSLPVSYELDLFDRLGATAAAAELDARAARDDVEALAMSLSAQLAETWFQLLELRERRALLTRQLELNETFLELVELRFREGLASAVDVHQQTTQVASTRAQLELVESQRAVTEYQLAILTGRAPSSDEISETRVALPDELVALPALGVPGDLVLHRPDVRAAKWRVTSADQRVGAAIADWFPSFTLSGSIGFNAIDLRELFDELIWSFVGSLSQRIFDGGQRSAEIRQNEALVSERLESFGQTLLTAVGEVESSLVQERQQGRYIVQLTAQVTALENTLREARQRYAEGLTDFLPVLTALNSLQAAELNLLAGRRQLISYRIQLYRSLGGSWTRRLLEPELSEPAEDMTSESDEESGT